MNNNKNNKELVQEFINIHLTDIFRAAILTLKRVSGIYCIVCTKTKAIYIGSAVDLSKRLTDHLIYGKSNKRLQKALTFYKMENFKIQILEYCELNKLIEREQYYLDWLFSQPNELRYNFCLVVKTKLGTNHSEETKQKISVALTGRIISEEIKAKISKSHIKKMHPFTGKVALNAIIVYIYSLENNLIEKFSSQILAAKYLNTTPKTFRRYLNNPILFKGKYFIKSDCKI